MKQHLANSLPNSSEKDKEGFSKASDQESVSAENAILVRQKLVTHWAKTTSMHGIGKLADDEIESPTLSTRIFWTLLLACSLAFMAYQVSQLIIKYSQFPVSTRSYAEDVASVQFPAVTICPINGFSSYRMGLRAANVSKVTKYIYAGPPNANLTLSSVSSASSNVSSCDEKWRQTMSNVPSKDYYLMASHGLALNALNNTLLSEVSVRLPEVLLDCDYYGMQCAPRDFVAFRNAVFGFCYTFNLNGTRSAKRFGPMNSLQMTLALNQSDYFDTGYGDAGFRILIHEPKTYPFAEAAGYHLSPGTSVQVGFTSHKFETLPDPYGTCRDYSDEENREVNAYVNASAPSIGGSYEKPSTVAYSHQACLRTCKQRTALKTCGCFLPCSFASDAQRTTMKPCEIRMAAVIATSSNGTLSKDASCVSQAYDTDCSDLCKFPCSRMLYQAHLSFAQFPAESYLRRLAELATASGYAADIARANSSARGLLEFARSNFLRVSVFTEEIKLHRTEDSPSYQMKDLLSDCGGQAGFWVGLSVLTVFEFVDLLTQLCRIWIQSRRHKDD